MRKEFVVKGFDMTHTMSPEEALTPARGNSLQGHIHAITDLAAKEAVRPMLGHIHSITVVDTQRTAEPGQLAFSRA